MSTVTLTKVEFDRLKRDLNTAKSARVKVGILGNKTDRQAYDQLYYASSSSSTINNAEIGLAHEYGQKTKNLPARSWLRMPLMTMLPKRLEHIGRAFWRTMILKTGVTTALKALGIEEENVVQRGFATQGFGQWAPWSRRYAAFRRDLETLRRARGTSGKITGGSILILSAQLRRAVTSRVTP